MVNGRIDNKIHVTSGKVSLFSLIEFLSLGMLNYIAFHSCTGKLILGDEANLEEIEFRRTLIHPGKLNLPCY